MSLKGRVIRGSAWSLSGHVIGQVLRLASSLIMTRLLVPEMFGVMAIAHMVQLILTLLSDIGLRQSIIHNPAGVTSALLNTAWTIQIVRGWVIWGICSLIALGISWGASAGLFPAESVYSSEDLPWVLAAVSFSAVVGGFHSTKIFTANRQINLKYEVKIELAAQIASLIISVALAWAFRSIWAFVIGAIASAACKALLSHIWIPGDRNRICWDRASAAQLIGYGKWLLMSSILFVLSNNVDRLLLGAWIDATTLGIYGLALNLAIMLEGAGGRLFGSVVMPALSEIGRRDIASFRSVYFKMRLPFDAAFVLGAGLLFAIGPALIDVLYDDRYAAGGEMLQVLSFTLFFARLGFTRNAYMALGRPQYLMQVNGLKLLSILVVTPLAYYFMGFKAALWAIALHPLPTLPLMYLINRTHDLNDLFFEIKMLLFWPAGYLFGLALVNIFDEML